MAKLRIIGLGLIFLLGCKTKIPEFIFEASKANHLIKYEYVYKDGKKRSCIEKTYTVMFGHIVDSIISKTIYEYNDKGLVLREISSHIKGKPDIKLYIYDSNDSLTCEFRINPDGDTTHIIKYAYFPDGRKVIYQRDIWMNLDESKNFITSFDNKTFDTISFTREYIYENNICKLLKEYDNKNMLSEVTEYEYKNGYVYKETIFSGLKELLKIKHFDYSKNKPEPEFFSVDKNNDTIEFRKYKLDDNGILNCTESYENGNIIITTFYKNSKEIGVISLNNYMNYKMSYLMSYYENGEIKEERSYGERIDAKIYINTDSIKTFLNQSHY